MIALAPDSRHQPRFTRFLRYFWVIACATALPLYDLVRTGSRLSLVGVLIGSSFLIILIIAHVYFLRIAPSVLSYDVRYEDLIIYTAHKSHRLPMRSVSSIAVFDGRTLGYRTGISVPGYHVGRYHAPELGLVQVIASAVQTRGLLIGHVSGSFFQRRIRYLFISPDEPEAVKLALESVLADHLRRLHLGQP